MTNNSVSLGLGQALSTSCLFMTELHKALDFPSLLCETGVLDYPDTQSDLKEGDSALKVHKYEE